MRIDVANQLDVVSIQVGSQTDATPASASQSLVDQLRVRFDGAATFGENVIEVEHVQGDVATLIPSVVTPAADVEGNTVANIHFIPGTSPYVNGYGSLVDGTYRIRVDGQVVYNSDANPMGVEVVDAFYTKFGDVDADGSVGLADFAVFRSAFGSTEGDLEFVDGLNYNRDDTIGLADFAAFRAAFGG